MKNLQLDSLIKDLKKKSIDEKVAIWKSVAKDLEKPSRNRRIVNLNKLNKYSKEGEIIVVPGKVLGDGTIQKNITPSLTHNIDCRNRLVIIIFLPCLKIYSIQPYQINYNLTHLLK